MSQKKSRKITFQEFGYLLQKEWKAGNISSKVHEMIGLGVIPIAHLREKMKWIIERDGNGLKMTVEPKDN